MMAFPKYESYQDSGVEWIGEIPAHWEVKRLKHIAKVQLSNVDKHTKKNEVLVQLCNYTDVYYRDFITGEIEFMRASATSEQIDKFKLEKGDVLITKDSESPDDIAISAFVPRTLEGVICGYHLAHLKPTNIKGHYLFRSFQAKGILSQFNMSANGITRYGISKSIIGNALFLIPTAQEQDRIAAFLDEKTREIDDAIAKKQQLIELLQEQKTILINNAVTKGLKRNVPMKESGVEWIGEIPTHWEVKKLKYFTSVQSGLTLGKSYSGKNVASYPYLRVANVQDGYFKLHDIAKIRVPSHLVSQYLVRSGDILVTEGGDIDKLGRGTVWEGQIDNCLHQNHIFAIRVNETFASKYFVSLVMGADYGRKYFTQTANKTTNLASTNKTKLGNFPLALPPIEEQTVIADHIGQINTEFESILSKVSSEIKRLHELKVVLIAEAVTGKIKVGATAGILI